MTTESNGLALARQMDEVLNREGEATAEKPVKEMEEPEGSDNET